MKASEFQVRRVVHGTLPDGRSGVLEDAASEHRLETPAFTLYDIWRFNGNPTPIDGDDRITETILTPEAGDAIFRFSAIAPDSEWGGDMSESLKSMGHEEASDDESDGAGGNPAFHTTDTVDVVVVLSGEVYCVTDTSETLLKAGDVIVQTGNSHAWSNRSDDVCVVAFVMVAGKR